MEVNRLKILVITPSLDPTENVSGISSVTRLMMEENESVEYTPFIVGKKDSEKKDLSWIIHLMGYPFRLFRELRKNTYQLIHFNIGYEPKSLLRDCPLFCLALFFSIPVILHVHGGRYMNKTSSFPYRNIIQFLMNRSRAVIVLSDLEKQFLLEHYKWKTPEKLYVLPTAVSLPSFSQEEKELGKRLNILYLGRLDRKKGLFQIAEALNQLIEINILFDFYLCGVGEDKDYFFQLLSAKTLPYVHDQGLVKGKEKDAILKQSHIFLLPSFFEGLPVALLESMAYYNVPVVTPVGSIPKVVNKENGFLISGTNEIVNAIKLLDSDRNLLFSLGKKSRSMIENKYSSTSFVSQLNQIIKFAFG